MSRPAVDSNIECIVSGTRLHLPLIWSLASLQSRSASRITWHAHDGYEILYLLDGATEYEFAGGESVILPGGHFLVVPPRVKHRGLHNVRRPARLCSILLNDRTSQGLTNTVFTRSDLKHVASQLEQAPRMAWPMSGDLRKLSMQLASQVRAFESSSTDSAVSLRLTTCETLWETARQLRVTRAIPPDEAVRAAMAYMESNLGQSFSMSDVAEAIGCGRARLFELFKEATGLTPNDYLQRMRVSRAASLLRETTLSITQIALDCGFNTSQYFSLVFRKYHNRTPSEVRQASVIERDFQRRKR